MLKSYIRYHIINPFILHRITQILQKLLGEKFVHND